MYSPLPSEYVAVGVCGILLYLAVAAVAIHSHVYRSKTLEQKYFFMILYFMSVFELPRYFSLAVNQDYTTLYASVPCYSLHIVADFLFFCCLALIALSFAHILELGPYISMLYSKRGLALVVASQAIVDSAAFIYCLTTTSLSAFFASDMYRFFTIFDMLQNLLFSGFLSFFGLRLILRFKNLLRGSTSENVKNAFNSVLQRVTTVLGFTTVMSALRLCLLVTKLVSTANDSSTTTPVFSLYGFLWLTLSDFLPRGVNALALVALMRTSQGANSSQQQPGPTRGDVQTLPQELQEREAESQSRGKELIVPDVEDMRPPENVVVSNIPITVKQDTKSSYIVNPLQNL